MHKTSIYTDFNGAVGENKLLLDGSGTKKDLKKKQITLSDGLELRFYDYDIDESGKERFQCVDGIIKFDKELDQWIAIVDWSKQYFLSNV